MSPTSKTAIVGPGASGDRGEHSATVGHQRDPRLNPAMTRKVAEARARWDDRPVTKRLLVLSSFDSMLDSLLEACLSYTDIGIACGVSRERIRQIHRDYFSAILPYSRGTGHKRVRICTIVRRNAALEELTPRGLAKEFADKATERGISVQAVVRGLRTPVASSKVVVANGIRLRLHKTETARHMSQRSIVAHYMFHISGLRGAATDFAAFKCGEWCWFIIPVAAIPRVTTLYIPDRPNTYHLNAHLKQTDWLWQYKDAWHLLKGER